jgi:hypothetical protein
VVPLESFRENFIANFPGITVPSTAGIDEVTEKVRFAGSLVERNPTKECHMLTEEKLDRAGARSEHMPHKSLRYLAQETSISNCQQPERGSCLNFGHAR